MGVTPRYAPDEEWPMVRRTRLIAAAMIGLTTALAGPGSTSVAAGAPAGSSAAAGARPRPYVAMGDSYSSGEGTFVYRRATDTATSQCHRSPLAYAPLLRARTPRLRPLAFVACSGARTRDLYASNSSYPGEPAQLQALTPATRRVSLTIGGNDVGFATVAAACVQSPRSTGFGCSARADLTALVRARLGALAGAADAPPPTVSGIVPVRQVLRDIGQRAPRARIFLAGYPELFGDDRDDYSADATAPSGASCQVNPIGARVDYADARWFNATTRQLNRVLRAAVRQAAADGVRVRYVSTRTFDGHGLCDRRTPWIQPVLLDQATGQPLAESLHPTARGQRSGYARAFRRAGL